MVKLTENELNEARMLNQQFQMVLAQKQALSIRVSELEAALKELDNSKGQVFYSAGSVLIESDKGSVTKRLEEQKKETENTLETITARENGVRKKLETFQKKVQEPKEE